MDIFDIVIVGGGPIGLACGIEAEKAGLRYVILEKGCLVNSLFNYPQHMTFFSTSEKLEIGGVPFVSTNPKPKRLEALEYYRRVQQKFSLNVRLFEEVINVTKKDDLFTVQTIKNVFGAKNVILATGFYDKPNLMQIPGENLPKVKHYYNDPHYYANQQVVVVGSSNSSVDAALETYRKGAKVTMVIRRNEISHRVKYWVRPDIDNRIAEGSIKAYFNSCLTAIEEHVVHIATPEGPITIKNDFVLALTGYQPNFDFLKKLGIRLSPDDLLIPEHDELTMETNIPHLYLAGVVCGGMNTHLWFIENSRVHAEQIIRHISG
ncbi:MULTISPECIES: YpdA family putative bacillithiol disulfide reductase [Olivibacter]|jgi:thioredoxin reductase (NADPH)|uniref:FAD-dependent pyridine nucleotide-disulfide oxidoreductase n=3 Tax=Sphingobacteriaceae TaxID=84566 RepID=F4C274_SPHS2|nr:MULTISPECIES: YpdA family putative bacillithiol disulfide reductase [Olivibacter]MCL4641141.1 YpdA family putative bacillithiol disulfide reductase [Olivibacter sp. UJ_SKK_5.1]MDM8175037.1 YpdA family putative bacillithiol disulfide reductase [Olivibacter sp. 47]MDX3913277.1 YpdA family putative bacillithiol disulfide reductase [Pseudosphingobacterium sp.]QEL01819.1 YpdA family putative bacillithiol disulfide reductase [Olivibacter sp. LS-1]